MAANELIKQNYRDIADAIRSKTGENGTMTAAEMPGKIENDLAKKPAGSLSITENGTGIDVSEKATVDVNVPNPSSGSLDITANGNYDVTEKAEVNVDVPTPTFESNYMYITDDSGNLLEDSATHYEADNRTIYWVDEEYSDPSIQSQTLSSSYVYTIGAGYSGLLDEHYLNGGSLYYYNTGGSGTFLPCSGLYNYGIYYWSGSTDFDCLLEEAPSFGKVYVYQQDDSSRGPGLYDLECHDGGVYNYYGENAGSTTIIWNEIELPENVGDEVTVDITLESGTHSFKITKLN